METQQRMQDTQTRKISKKKELDNFITQYDHLPKQGTPEWKSARHNFIGGSEISTLLNKNKYKTLNKLILEKIGVDQFTGSAATYWGNVFEPLVRNYSNRLFKCFIRETGSIPFKNTNLSYSPDGIAVVHYKDIKSRIDPEIILTTTDMDSFDDMAELTILFEFKCPHSRVPDDIEVPEHYISQPLIGMNIINICELSIFIEAIFRRCQFADLQYNNEYITYGHYNRIQFDETPLECGFMVLYTYDYELYNDIVQLLQDVGTKKIRYEFDLGTLFDKDLFDLILQHCVSGDIRVDNTFNYDYNQDIFTCRSHMEYHEDYDSLDEDCEHIPDSYEQIPSLTQIYNQELYNKALHDKAVTELDKQRERLKKVPIIGVLSYKLLKTYIKPIYKNHNFIEENDLIRKSGIVIDFIANNKETPITDLKKTLRRTKLFN